MHRWLESLGQLMLMLKKIKSTTVLSGKNMEKWFLMVYQKMTLVMLLLTICIYICMFKRPNWEGP